MSEIPIVKGIISEGIGNLEDSREIVTPLPEAYDNAYKFLDGAVEKINEAMALFQQAKGAYSSIESEGWKVALKLAEGRGNFVRAGVGNLESEDAQNLIHYSEVIGNRKW